MTRVQSESFLTLHYRLGGASGDIVNTYDGPPATLSLGSGQLAPALEQRLIGLEEGAHVVFDLAPGAVFGERQPEMLQWVARSLLDRLGEPGASYDLGEAVEFPAPDGQGKVVGVVREVRDDGAVLFDFNHPLAGQPVRFEVSIIGVL